MRGRIVDREEREAATGKKYLRLEIQNSETQQQTWYSWFRSWKGLEIDAEVDYEEVASEDGQYINLKSLKVVKEADAQKSDTTSIIPESKTAEVQQKMDIKIENGLRRHERLNALKCATALIGNITKQTDIIIGVKEQVIETAKAFENFLRGEE